MSSKVGGDLARVLLIVCLEEKKSLVSVVCVLSFWHYGLRGICNFSASLFFSQHSSFIHAIQYL